MHRLHHPSLFRSIKWQKSCIMMHVRIFFKRHAMDHTHSLKVQDGVLILRMACCKKINPSLVLRLNIYHLYTNKICLTINCSNTGYYAILIYYFSITYSIWLYIQKLPHFLIIYANEHLIFNICSKMQTW